MLLSSKCGAYNIKKLIVMKEQEASRLWSSLGLKTSSSKTPLLRDILFLRYKMDETVNKFLLAEDKFMTEMHLRQPRFSYSACGLFIKSKREPNI